MTQLTPLDTKELSAWLTRVTQTIDRSLRDPVRTDLAVSLREGLGTKVGIAMLTQAALLGDCLRVAHLAVEADGEIDEELARVHDLVKIAAPKFFQLLPAYEGFEDGIASSADVARFMKAHRADSGPFGFGDPRKWRGLELARAVETTTRNAGPLREHESMLARVMDEVFAGKQSDIERNARRELRGFFETTPPPGSDPRALAFCRNDGPEVFSSVAYGGQIHERDLFDVEAIHADARAAFQREVERAITPAQHAAHGRTLLVLGDSGSGKTHLLRAIRAQTHSQRLGYVGYLQMTSEVADYSRYVLRNLIDSLERSYDAPTAKLSGLSYLSDGIVGERAGIPKAELEQLRTAELSSDELDRAVGKIIDRIVRTEGLEDLEVDLLHALLLLQRQDNALQRRVVKYLRCEQLGAHDRTLLGGLASRDQADDPLRTIRQLAKIMYELQMASLVLLVDQIEDAAGGEVTVVRMQQALDSLRAIADSVPSSVVVIACLQDIYNSHSPKLSASLRDRLERDPGPVRLATQRDAIEIEQMLARRLEHLYSTFDAPWREDEPIYPFTAAHVAAVHHMRARDCLAKFREYHNACIAAGRLLDAPAATATPTPVAPVVEAKPNLDLERRWNDALVAEVELPDEDDELLALLEEGIRAAAIEVGATIELAKKSGKVDHLALRGPTLSNRIVAVCNKNAQGGHLTRQLDAVRAAAPDGVTAFAVRMSDWTAFTPKSTISKKVGELISSGGHAITIGERELRAIIAMRELVATKVPGLAAWRTLVRPLAQLAFVRDLFDLDRVPTLVPPMDSKPPQSPQPAAATRTIPVAPPIPAPPPRPKTETTPPADPSHVRLGATITMRAEPITLPLEKIKTHVAFLGTTGSGKTTAALSVVEQVLERGVSVLLVDRKGDLATYAREPWWTEDPRRAALRRSIDIALYTPGNAQGRPLRLPIAPPMADADQQDRDQLAKFAASGLGAMMGFGNNATHRHKSSILQCAVALNSDREVTLDVLVDTIERPDPELLQRVGALQKFFPGLGEDLQSLKIQRGSLLAGSGDVLDVAAMFPAPGATTKPRLTIINTASIAEIPVLEFWISRLLVELGRLARKRPSKTLQAAAFFDEADAYIPAVGNPPPKEPMFDLLRRARAAGIGMLLATQNPGDLDYKARELIGTWLVGKISSPLAIEKMRTLLGPYPNVGSRLANQPTGQFFVLKDGTVAEVKCDRSMMETEQLSESEVAALARG